MWILIAAGIYFLLLCAWRMQGEDARTYGSAQWCKVWPLFRQKLFARKGIIVGDWTGLLAIFFDLTHQITIGTSGSGKGTGAIVPNALHRRYLIMVDPGGENSAIAAKRWRRAGYEFRCINFFGMHKEAPWALPEHGFNPLDLLDPASSTFAADALLIAKMIIKRSAAETGNSIFFLNRAEEHVRDFIVHCKTTEPPARQNLATIYEYVHGSARDWAQLLEDMKANPVCGHLVRNGAYVLDRQEGQSSEEFSGVFSTIQQNLNWLADPLIRDFMSRSDVDFSILKGLQRGQRGGVVSVILPLQYNKSHAAISRLALACAVLTLQRAPLAKEKVLLLIDEAADLGRIDGLADWLATLRKYRVTIWPIFQSLGQISELYGRGWQTIIANCGMLQILGIGHDLETAQYMERLLGQGTVQSVSFNAKNERSLGQAGRSLITADELRRLKSNEQIVLIGNLPPIRLKKTPYWERPEFAFSYYPNPYVDGKARMSPLAFEKWLWGKLYYLHVWLMAPHWIVAVLVTYLLVAYVGIPFGHVAYDFVTTFIEGITR